MPCPNDETLLELVEGRLRGRALVEIDSHLDACELCRELVATLGSGPRRKRGRDGLERGDEIGRFTVLDKIGEGAMGAVYAAYDPELDRKVALKLLHGDRSDAKARARLVREAQAMARLSHPHVVTVYDVGTRDHDVYVAMELVEGQSLRAWLAEERTPAEILKVFRSAGQGLVAAHAAGLVHRDFKPENVLVDQNGEPKVGDFGLATGDGDRAGAVPEGALLDASITRTGALLGTPAYMAPEQLTGEGADARADQFAFCVALFEALDGARPFRGETIAQLRDAIEQGPSSKRLAGGVDAALRRGLSPAREDRHPDMASLLAALEPGRPFPLAWLGLGAACVLAAGGAWAGLTAETPAAPCDASATALDVVWNESAQEGLASSSVAALEAWTRRWTLGRVDACEATQVRHEQSAEHMDRRMRCLDQQRTALEVVLESLRDPESEGVAIDTIETLPDPVRCDTVARVPPPDADSMAEVERLSRQLQSGRVALAGGDLEGALEAASRSVEAANETGYAPLVANANLLHAQTLRALARSDDAEAAAEAGLLVADAAGDDRGAAEGWLEQTRIAGARGRFTQAAQHARHADAAITRAGRPADLADELLHLRGVLRTNLGELREAEDDLRAGLRSVSRRLGEDSPRLASLHTSLGNVLRVQSLLPEALAEHRLAMRIDAAALGENHPRVGRDLHNIAGVLRRLGRESEAMTRYTRALEIKRAALGDLHPEVALTRNSLGLMARERGDLAEARRQWDAAAEILRVHRHGDEALVRFNLALIDVEQARWAEALDNVSRAIRLDTDRIGPRSKRVGSENVLFAHALVGLGRFEEARAAAAIAVSIGREMGDDELTRNGAELLREATESFPPSDAPRRPRRPSRARASRVEASPGPSPEARVDTEVADPIVGPATPTPVTLQPPPTPEPPPPAQGRRPSGSASYGASQAWE